jgi:hypothetical protein
MAALHALQKVVESAASMAKFHTHQPYCGIGVLG